MSKPNFQVTNETDKKVYWISRSCAVCVIPLFVVYGEGTYIPLGKRSSTLPDFSGQYGLVCGYLDWDESLKEAALRETKEELGLDLDEFGGLPEQPSYTHSNPLEDARQNITHRFVAKYFVQELPRLKTTEEVSQTRWISSSELKTLKEPLAFNHRDVIEWSLKLSGSLSFRNA